MLNNWTSEEEPNPIILKSKWIHPFIQARDEEDLEKSWFFLFFYLLFENNTKRKAINSKITGGDNLYPPELNPTVISSDAKKFLISVPEE